MSANNTETQAALVIQHLQASAHQFRQESERCRQEGQATQDPYLMGQAVAYLECATRLMERAATIEMGRRAGKVRLEVVS